MESSIRSNPIACGWAYRRLKWKQSRQLLSTPKRLAIPSCRQHLIEFVEQRKEAVTKDLLSASQTAPAGEGIEFHVLRFDGEAGRDVIADGLKPAKLIGAEVCAGALLRTKPRGKAGLDLGATRFKLRLLLEGEANEIDQVGGNLGAAAAHMRGVDALVGAPKLVGSNVRTAVDWLLDQIGQRLDLLEREAHGIGLAIENLQHFDFILVFAEELLKRLHHAQGALANHFRGAGFQEMVLVDRVDNLLVTLLYTKDEVAQGGIGGQRLGSLVQHLLAGLGDFGFRRLGLRVRARRGARGARRR